MFISNISEPISKEEYANTNMLFEALNATVRLTNSSMFVVDFAKNKMAYRTDNLIFVDEATPRDIQRKSQNPYWSLIVEDDLAVLLDTRVAYLEFFKSFKAKYGAQNEAYMSRLAEKWVRGLCFNELGACG